MDSPRYDLVAGWQRYTSLLQGMITTEPLLLPLIRRWIDSSGSSRSFSCSQILSRRIEKIRHHSTIMQTSEPSDINRSEQKICDVLFLPGFARVSCLGASQLASQAVWKLNPDCRIGIIPPKESGEANLPELDERFIPLNLVEEKLPSPRFFQTAWSFVIQVKQRLQADSTLSYLWRKDWPIRLLEIARFQGNMARAKDLLQKTHCRLVVCLNEQLWPASVFIPAAKKLGIPTAQILHGTPTRLYWPFISDETWVWDKSTYAILEEYGAPRSRMYVTGNLEASFWLTDNDVCERNKQRKKNDLQTCLFLSQWAGSKIWSVPGFDEPVNWLAEAITKQKDRWRVVVRLHPYDGVDAQTEIYKKLSFLGDNLTFSDSRTKLIEDVLDADVVVTGSSTAILMAQMYDKPVLLLWTPVMEYIHGRPFLEERQVVYSGRELSDRMQSGLSPSIEVSRKNIAYNSDRVAAQRILQLLT